MKNKILLSNLAGFIMLVFAFYFLYKMKTTPNRESMDGLTVQFWLAVISSIIFFIVSILLQPKRVESMTPEERARYLARELDSYRRTWYLESSGNGMYKCYVLTRKEWGKPSPNNLLPVEGQNIETKLMQKRIENHDEVQRILDLSKRR